MTQLPAAIQGINGIARRREIRAAVIPNKHESKIAGYHLIGPSTIPIRPAYHMSARPSRFLDMKKASKKMAMPRMPPTADSTRFPGMRHFRMKKNNMLPHSRNRETAPFFMSKMEINRENKE
jgi:hypothetical protein